MPEVPTNVVSRGSSSGPAAQLTSASRDRCDVRFRVIRDPSGTRASSRATIGDACTRSRGEDVLLVSVTQLFRPEGVYIACAPTDRRVDEVCVASRCTRGRFADRASAVCVSYSIYRRRSQDRARGLQGYSVCRGVCALARSRCPWTAVHMVNSGNAQRATIHFNCVDLTCSRFGNFVPASVIRGRTCRSNPRRAPRSHSRPRNTYPYVRPSHHMDAHAYMYLESFVSHGQQWIHREVTFSSARWSMCPCACIRVAPVYLRYRAACAVDIDQVQDCTRPCNIARDSALQRLLISRSARGGYMGSTKRQPAAAIGTSCIVRTEYCLLFLVPRVNKTNSTGSWMHSSPLERLHF